MIICLLECFHLVIILCLLSSWMNTGAARLTGSFMKTFILKSEDAFNRNWFFIKNKLANILVKVTFDIIYSFFCTVLSIHGPSSFFVHFLAFLRHFPSIGLFCNFPPRNNQVFSYVSVNPVNFVLRQYKSCFCTNTQA